VLCWLVSNNNKNKVLVFFFLIFIILLLGVPSGKCLFHYQTHHMLDNNNNIPINEYSVKYIYYIKKKKIEINGSKTFVT
jgi:hypothetical protein